MVFLNVSLHIEMGYKNSFNIYIYIYTVHQGLHYIKSISVSNKQQRMSQRFKNILDPCNTVFKQDKKQIIIIIIIIFLL